MNNQLKIWQQCLEGKSPSRIVYESTWAPKPVWRKQREEKYEPLLEGEPQLPGQSAHGLIIMSKELPPSNRETYPKYFFFLS